MVDVREPGAPRVNFLDFGFWKVEDPTLSKSCTIILKNLYFAHSPMKRLLILVGFGATEWDNTYEWFLQNSDNNTDKLLKLPSKLVLLWRTTSNRLDILSTEFRVVEKLCAIWYMQDKEKISIDVISYQDNLDDLIRAMPEQTVNMALSKLWSHNSSIS